MKNKKKMIQLMSICCVFMVVSIIITFYKTNVLIKDGYEKDLRVESRMIANAVENNILRPLIVSETMSKDMPLREILTSSSKQESIKKEKEAADYLETIKDGFGYSMVFAVNDKYGTYYTYDGISKFINVDTNVNDRWYKYFLEREGDKIYKMDVDTDEANNWSLSVFINTEVNDAKGNYIGCCGIGVEMTELQNILERFERIYDVKINLIDKAGLIQIDTDAQRIERDYINIGNLNNYSDGECYYETGKDYSRTIMYLDSLEWYLVVENDTPIIQSFFSMIVPNMICIGIGIVVVVVFTILVTKEKEDTVVAGENL